MKTIKEIKKEWNKVYCKNCKKYLGRITPKCCFCNTKCQIEYEEKNEKMDR